MTNRGGNDKMEIYLTNEGNLEIKSVEKEPWPESDLNDIFGELHIILIKTTFQYLGINRVVINIRCVNNIQKLCASIKITFNDGQTLTIDRLAGQYEFNKEIFKFLIEPIIARDYQTRFH